VVPRTKSKERADEVLDVVDDEELDDDDDVEVVVELEEDDVVGLEVVSVVLVVRLVTEELLVGLVVLA
jgi:hypothetical protein